MTARRMPTVSEISLAVHAIERKGLGHLRWRLDGDVLVILDLEEGRYHALGRDASRRFFAYAKGASDTELEATLVEAGLLGGDHQKARPLKPIILPGQWLMAAKTLLVARRQLTKKKFRLTLDWALAHCPSRPLPNAVLAFRKAEAVFPSRLGDRDCLPRALGLFAFLRHATFEPDFVVGFKRHPFTAHAWVEVDGAPVLESQSGRNHIVSFHEILRVC